MSKPKHTLGPWCLSANFHQTKLITNEDCDEIVKVNNKQDAHLISAAPEMYELIKELMDQPGQLFEDIIKMKSLIAKAEGRDK